MVREQRMVVAAIEGLNGQKILILGAFGMLGRELQSVFPHAVFKGRDLDITDERTVQNFIRTSHFDIVVNAAAYTDVDGCEENRALAFSVNGESLEYIAAACREISATLVHYSTDHVFDGEKRGYSETDIPRPINIYGSSKLLGEENIRNSMDDFRIIRTSWLFGIHGKNFVETILCLSKELPEVRIVNDQTGKPTYAADLALKTREIIEMNPGIYHITNDGICTRYELAQAFIPNAVPCSSDEFPGKARRPKNSVLNNTKTRPMRHWKTALSAYLHQRGNIT